METFNLKTVQLETLSFSLGNGYVQEQTCHEEAYDICSRFKRPWGLETSV